MVLVTGASGFIGRSLCRTLLEQGWRVRGMVRSEGAEKLLPPKVDSVYVQDIADVEWEEILDDVQVVVHLAGQVPGGRRIEPAQFLRVNVEATVELARAAAHAGVRRLVHLSSAHVHGEGRKEPYRENDPISPISPYAASKAMAEKKLSEVVVEAGLETVVLRPSIVYGPGVKGKLLRLLQWVSLGLPLPFGGMDTPLSMLFLDNLIDAIAACLTSSAAAGKTFLLRDGEDLALPELINRMALRMDLKAKLLPIRHNTMIGKICGLNRLSTSIRVDDSLIRRTLGWHPPFSCDDGLEQMVLWYLQGRR